jgi:hypothetical protein
MQLDAHAAKAQIVNQAYAQAVSVSAVLMMNVLALWPLAVILVFALQTSADLGVILVQLLSTMMIVFVLLLLNVFQDIAPGTRAFQTAIQQRFKASILMTVSAHMMLNATQISVIPQVLHANLIVIIQPIQH